MARGLTPEQATAELIRQVPVLEQEGRAAMERAVEITFQRLAEFAPGSLGRDAIHSVRSTRTGVAGTVRPRAPWAQFVEGGTGEGKTIRHHGRAFSRTTGRSLTASEEAGNAHDVLTASGYGSKSGGPLALHIPGGGVIYRAHVRGQRAQGFVERTREATADEVEHVLLEGAQRATARLG